MLEEIGSAVIPRVALRPIVRGSIMKALSLEGTSALSLWASAVAVLAWLAVAGAITDGVYSMLSLWALGSLLGFLAVVAGRNRVSHGRANNSLNGHAAPSAGPEGNRGTTKVPSSPTFPSTASVSGPTLVEAPGDKLARANSETVKAPVEWRPTPPLDEPTHSSPTPTFRPPVLTAQEAADMLRVPLANIVEAMRDGDMPGNCVGDEWRCSARSIEAWLDGCWSGRRQDQS